jgi:tetratricopeptide (TPR) repeat protein
MLRRVALALLTAALLLAGPRPTVADDVPEEVRSLYDDADAALAAGDAKKAYSLLSKARLKEPWSVDFWVLYVRVWRALEKPEDVLWERIVGKQADKDPKSPVFDVVRARLETDPARKIGHLRNAVAKDERAVAPRLLLARALVKQGDDIEAEEVLDAALKIDPGNEQALVTKGDLMIASGFARSALEFVEKELAEHALPGLHDLYARALLLVAENDESKLQQALEEARKAVAARPDPDHVLTLSEVLDRMGKTAEAVAALEEHQKRKPSPALAGRLGRLAFRAGRYAQALPGLRALAADDAAAARCLASAEARLGHAKETAAALDQLLAQDPDAVPFAAAQEMAVGNAPGALKRLAGRAGDDAEYLRAHAHAWLGAVPETEALAREKAATGTRAHEELLLLLQEARLFQRLGAKADAVRKTLLQKRHAAGAEGLAEAALPEFEASYDARSFGFMMRFSSYRRCLDGTFFAPQGMFPIARSKVDGVEAVGTGVIVHAECPRDAERVFPFNAQKIEGGNITVTFSPNQEIWAAAQTAFVSGAQALAAGDWAKASEAFGQALEQEPTWGRARVLKASADLLGGGDAKAAAALAAEALAVLPEDWEARTLAILLAALAGDDVSAAAEEVGRLRERYAPRRVEELR